MSDKIYLRRGLRKELPALAVGEPGFATDTAEMFVGSSFGNIPFGNSTRADTTIYVSPTGSDANEGSSANPLKTIQAAINKIPQIVNHITTIIIANGTYAEDLLVRGFVGMGDVYILGNISAPGNVKVNSIKAERMIRVHVAGIEFTTITRTAITIYSVVSAFIHNTTIQGSSGGYSGLEAQQCNIIYTDSIISNRARGISALYGAMVHSANNLGSANVTGLYADSGAVISKNGTQPAGTTAEAFATGGVIR